MRNLKKMLSLVMALAMIASFMVVGASAAEFTDAKDITNTDAVNTLVSLGVIKGRDTGAFDPTGIVTRAEMAKMICVAYNGGTDPVLGTSTTASYKDTVGHWASGYIEYCTNLKIVTGYQDGNFYPDKTVSGAEAAKMLLVTLGYDPTVFGFTGANWQTNTDVQANSAKLYDSLKGLNSSNGLSRDNAAQMIYNALNAYVMEKTYDKILSNGEISYSYKLSDNKTFLTEKFGVTRVEAVIVGNEYATLSGGSDAAKDAGKTQIVLLDPTDPGYAGTYKVSTSLDMLGQSVTMFIKYKNNSDKDAVVFGTPVLSTSNKIVTATDGSDLANDGATKGLLAKNDLTVSSSTKVLKNYEDITPATVNAGNIDTALAQVSGGTIALIDNDGDDVVEYVIYTEYSAGVVTLYSTADKGSIKITGFDKNEKATEQVVGFDNVAKGDYVLAVEFGGKIYVEKPETVTGKMESYSTSKETVKVDGTTYDFSGITNNMTGSTVELEKVKDYVSASAIGNSGTYYLDNNGYVLSVGNADETYDQFAVILAKQAYGAGTASTLGTEAKVKVLLSDGTIETVAVYSIDGVKPGAAAYSAKETAVAQYDVYSYAKTDDGKIKLGTEKGSVVTGAQTLTYTNGRSTLAAAGSNYAVTSNTIFLYYNGDKVNRFVGKTSPDASFTGNSTNFTVAHNTAGEATLVYVNTAANKQFDGNYMYVYKTKISENADGWEVSGILSDGTIDTFTVDAATLVGGSTAISGMTITVGMYNYSKDGSVYTLSRQDNLPAGHTDGTMDYVASGTVTASKSDYINIGSRYTVNSSTIVAYGKTNKTATVGEALNVGDTVTVVYNDDDEVVLAVITEYAADTYAATITGKDGSNKLTYELNNGTVTPASGADIPAGATLTVTAAASNMAKVTVNGVVSYYKTGETFTMPSAPITVDFVAQPTVAVSSGASTVYAEAACINAITYAMPNTTVYTKATTSAGYLTGTGLTLVTAATSSSGAVYSFEVGTTDKSVACTADAGYTITMAGTYTAAGKVIITNGNNVEIIIPASAATFTVPTGATIKLDTTLTITSVELTASGAVSSSDGVYTLTGDTTITLADS